MNEANYSHERDILLSAVLSFSPQTQYFQKNALDGIIESVFTEIEDKSKSVSIEELSNLIKHALSTELHLYDITEAINRLLAANRIEKDNKGLYKISSSIKNENIAMKQKGEALIDSVIHELFIKNKIDIILYKNAFISFLCFIFTELENDIIKVIKNEIQFPLSLFQLHEKFKTLKSIKKDYKFIDEEYFISSVSLFFDSIDNINYNTLKWTFGRYYFVIKVLGLDNSNKLLSENIFKDYTFILDTNILISIIFDSNRHHENIISLLKSIDKLGNQFKICNITFLELESWLSHQTDILKKVIDEVPCEIINEINSDVLSYYKKEIQKDNNLSFYEIFEFIFHTRDKLKGLITFSEDDDRWFDINKDDEKVINFSKVLSENYLKLRRKVKGFKQAKHDALLLMWNPEVSLNEAKPHIIVTLDNSLLISIPPGCDKSVSISLDALLHWMFPIIQPEIKSSIEIFADMVKNKLLPQEKLFTLEDFEILTELQINCKDLPVEDVKECIKHMKDNFPFLNIFNVEEKQKLISHVYKFFINKVSKYKKNEVEHINRINNLEKMLEKLSKQSDDNKNDYENKFLKMEESFTNILNDQNIQFEKRIEEINSQNKDAIKKIISEKTSDISDEKKNKMKYQTYFYFSLLSFGFIILTIVLFLIFYDYIVCSSFSETIKIIGILFPFYITLILVFIRLILGKERINYLPWGISKIFGGDGSNR